MITPKAKELSGKEVFCDPKLFAEWLLEYLVCDSTFESDLGIAPSAEQCARLKISDDERIACANEYVLLRALAAMLYVRQQNPSSTYIATFDDVMMSRVEARMKKHAPAEKDPNSRAGIRGYLSDFENDNPALPFCLSYLGRIYPSNPIVGPMLTTAKPNIPIEMGFNYVVGIKKLVHEGVLALVGFKPTI